MSSKPKLRAEQKPKKNVGPKLKKSAEQKTKSAEQKPKSAEQIAKVNEEPKPKLLVLNINLVDRYIKEYHWYFGYEYIFSSLSTVFMSLLILYIIICKIEEKCWKARQFLFIVSLILTILTIIYTILVIIIWNFKHIYYLFWRSRVCLAMISCHYVLGSFHIIFAIICYASRTCFQMNKLDQQFMYNVPLRYETKTLGILHSLIAITLFVCAVLLAIKRNDFKYYVLWRKGLLNAYLRQLYDND